MYSKKDVLKYFKNYNVIKLEIWETMRIIMNYLNNVLSDMFV